MNIWFSFYLPELTTFTTGNQAFRDANYLELSGSIDFIYLFDLPKLSTFIVGQESFKNTQKVRLSSLLFWFYLVDLPEFSYFETKNYSFCETSYLSLSSTFIRLFSLDASFNNGIYKTESMNNTFCRVFSKPSNNFECYGCKCCFW